MKDEDMALMPGRIILRPGSFYQDENRKWQGIPGIEALDDNVFWAVFYSGGEGEGPDNYCVAIRSMDGGKSWSRPLIAVHPQSPVRAFDPCIWKGPDGVLRFFWAQSYGLFDGRCGVFCMNIENGKEDDFACSEPRRIANGIMMNKPTVLSTGEWLLPCAVWEKKNSEFNFLPEERFSNVYVSRDEGRTYRLLGSADIPDRCLDENMVVEKEDSTLWMLSRTSYGIGESFSFDKGVTWSKGQDTKLGGPTSRFFIRRLKSGNLLLVNHMDFTGRNNLCAKISKDDGKTWEGGLFIDKRDKVSYPDGTELDNGFVYIVYDRDRYGEMEILTAGFREEDVLKGKLVTKDAFLQRIINKGGHKK